MNLYEKIQQIKFDIKNTKLKKSGKNSFAKYEYFELADFLPLIIEKCNEYKVYTSISFTNEKGILTVINSEEPTEKIEYESPVTELELKGCNKVQALGGIQTYLRRYLYMNAFDIVEHDMFDAVTDEKEYKCVECGKQFEDFTSKEGKKYTGKQMYHISETKNGKALCFECAKKLKENKEIVNE